MTRTSSRVRKAYDEWAEVYDTNDNPTRDLNARVLREAALPLEERRLLEIGCGTGLNTDFLSREAGTVVGVDLSDEMLARARHRVQAENVQFVSGDITKRWAFGDASFDFVVANLVLEHVEKLSFAFSEAFRVLRVGGFLYIGELHPYKQLRGAQARYQRSQTGENVLVDAFVHPISEYVNEGIDAGFRLRWLNEWQNEGDDVPRLLTLLFKKDA